MKVVIVFISLIAFIKAGPLEIVGGHDAAPGQFPSNVAIYVCTLEIFCSYYCGGTVLSNDWILTAAHCLYEGNQPLEPHRLKIIAGTQKLSVENATRQEIKGLKKVLHPDFNTGGSLSLNDIALVKLEKPLVYNDNIKPVKLPEPAVEPTEPATITGFGSIGGIIFETMADNLQYVSVPIVPYAECRSIFEAKFPGKTFALDEVTTICTGPLTGDTSACSGDSGSPMYNDDTVVGTVSWGYNTPPCGSSRTPVVYTKISKYTTWITETISQ